MRAYEWTFLRAAAAEEERGDRVLFVKPPRCAAVFEVPGEDEDEGGEEVVLGFGFVDVDVKEEFVVASGVFEGARVRSENMFDEGWRWG